VPATWPPRRREWARARLDKELEYQATKRYGGKSPQRARAFRMLVRAAAWGLQRVGQYERGVRNANGLVLRQLELGFPHLPRAFDGFSILHVSDPHFDGMSGLDQRVLETLERRVFDLCVLTGDYRMALHGPIQPAMDALQRLVGGLRARDGIIGVLGNHDSVHMVEPMEKMGVRVLVNEAVVLERHSQRVQLIGTDDVHYYRTDQALGALSVAREAFSIVLVHSPELCEAAAVAGAELYLCGHTHAGQICLPGGFPIIRQLTAGHRYYRGSWCHRGMRGVTSSGVGTSGIPVRFNTRPELIAIRLRCDTPPK
jgi:predicted MPP superfamily phosphohydrolase